MSMRQRQSCVFIEIVLHRRENVIPKPCNRCFKLPDWLGLCIIYVEKLSGGNDNNCLKIIIWKYGNNIG